MNPADPVRGPDAPMHPVRGPAVWRADDMAGRDDWLHVLAEDEVAELSAAADEACAGGFDLLGLDRGRFDLSSSLSETLARIRSRIIDGLGFVQIRGLPVARFGRRKAATIFWGIAQHFGDEVVSQNARGNLLDHVKDIGQEFRDPTSRGPYTRERIEYHTDACDVVGLLCLHPSVSGGESTLASGGAVHNEMLCRRPDLVEALLEPVYRDRRGEVPSGREPWYAMPVFNFFEGHLSITNEPSYIDSVARFFDTNPNSPAQLEGLRLLDEIAEELHFDIAFEAGDMQFLHNHTVMHSRQAFTDFPDPARKRHLLRIWLLTHDGRPVPPVFFERNGSPDTSRRPGGIVGTDTTPRVPLDGL
ncbi:MAG: TauD/TfdA family dioxygenase [Immundisolibacterales bacterium]|nr:TauD/TfdA family dioxygenase [Immundisolibacterales bacterium]